MDPSEIQRRLLTDRQFRVGLTTQSLPYFISTYFPHYLTDPTADFQREMIRIAEDESLGLAVICAFRNSGKSTYMTTMFPIWAVIGVQQKKLVVIASQTQYQARVHLMNIKKELETNELLASDLGPFVEQREEWGATSLYIPKYNARITAISVEQSVRGIRNSQFRPDLIICDDVEDQASTRTMEGRDKTDSWFTRDIVPGGDTYTRRIVVGNLLHEDSLIMRLKARIEDTGIDGVDGIYREWPIVKDGKSLWSGKYPDMAAVEALRRTVGNKIAWEREYMLRIIPDEDQIIDPSWIRFYDQLPEMTKANEYLNSFISVDLAISEKQHADFTGIILIHAFGFAPENRTYYIDKRFTNKRLTHLKTIEAITAYYHLLLGIESSEKPRALIEDVSYQHSAVEQLDKDPNIEVIGVRIRSDKRARLQLASYMIEQGRVFFPTGSGTEIIQQLVNFGVEKHDDLADAVSMGLNYIQTKVILELKADFGRAGDSAVDGKVYRIKYND